MQSLDDSMTSFCFQGDSDELKPYKKDLEYLGDHFQVYTFVCVLHVVCVCACACACACACVSVCLCVCVCSVSYSSVLLFPSSLVHLLFIKSSRL